MKRFAKLESIFRLPVVRVGGYFAAPNLVYFFLSIASIQAE